MRHVNRRETEFEIAAGPPGEHDAAQEGTGDVAGRGIHSSYVIIVIVDQAHAWVPIARRVSDKRPQDRNEVTTDGFLLER